MTKKILLLGSGELGKELTIALKRLGQEVVAVDSYANAPASEVTNTSEVIDMLDGDALDAVVAKHKPDLIVPEIEAIRTDRLYDYEAQGMQVVPSARAANFTMNRKAIRDLAANELGIRTAKYAYASTRDEYIEAVKAIGIPCVVKPLMSSSGKGQSIVRSEVEIDSAWENAMTKARASQSEIIIEEFIPFESEITLLTVTQKSGRTLFCPPIGHRQERGDYMESWQPAVVSPELLEEAQQVAQAVTSALTGAGIWGVEFFLTNDKVYFSELSPRPHDTGMVTLAHSQSYSEFELHARAILGLPIPQLELKQNAASAVILASEDASGVPEVSGLAEALQAKNIDVRIFGKPMLKPYRRMGVALAFGEQSTTELRQLAADAAATITINSK